MTADRENGAIFNFCTISIHRIICVARGPFTVQSRRTLVLYRKVRPMEKNEKGSIDISELRGDLEKFINAFERIRKLTNWMTTVSLSILGFIMAILFQIKSNSQVPNKQLAAGVVVAFIISVLLGFYCRFRYELFQFREDLRRGARGVSGIFKKVIKEYSLQEENAEVVMMADARFKELIGKFSGRISKHTLIWPVIVQFLVLTIGSILWGAFIGLYLFTSL